MSHIISRILMVAACLPILTLANTRHFTYTYESAVLAPGEKEIETSNTWRAGKRDMYSRIDQNLEFEMGLMPHLQTALYLKTSGKTFWENGEIKNETSTPSLASEWKVQLLNPSISPVGLALYGEVELATDEIAYEGKIIADKSFGNFLMALNLVGEQNFQPHGNVNEVNWANEVELETDLGLAYMVHNQYGLGLEFRQHNVLVDGELEHAVLFAGPTLSYSSANWWVTLSVLPQMVNVKEGENLDLDEYERLNTRLLFAWHL